MSFITDVKIYYPTTLKMSTKTSTEKKRILLIIIFSSLVAANILYGGLKRFGEHSIGKGWGDILQGGTTLLLLIVCGIFARRINKQIKSEKENTKL